MTPRTLADDFEDIAELADTLNRPLPYEPPKIYLAKKRAERNLQTEINRIARGYSLPPGVHEF